MSNIWGNIKNALSGFKRPYSDYYDRYDEFEEKDSLAKNWIAENQLNYVIDCNGRVGIDQEALFADANAYADEMYRKAHKIN